MIFFTKGNSMNTSSYSRLFTALAVIAWSFIILPITPAYSSFLTSPSQVETEAVSEKQNSDDPQSQQRANWAQYAGSTLASIESHNDFSALASNHLRGVVANAATTEVEHWLSSIGNARVRIDVDQNFTLKNSEFDFLLPWYDAKEWLVFSQQSLHRTDDRTQINLGTGVRYFGAEWMTGINAFYDYDLTRYHSRAGIGAELWRDYLKLSANSYFRLSNWRSAPELNNDYEARPANGWDIRAEGWLPAYPQLGAKLAIEQYYGNEVALFGTDNRQANPSAITAGLNWTPIPLVTLSGERSMGTRNMSESRFGLQLSWTPGMSWSQHLDPDSVRERRTLAGSRLDLVERNNNIVLEYRKKELIQLFLREKIEGKEGQVFTLVTGVKSKYPLQYIEWVSTDFLSAGGTLSGNGTATQLILPAWRPANTQAEQLRLNTYTITGFAHDDKGNRSKRADTIISVKESSIQIKAGNFTVESGARANGTDVNIARALVTDSTGKAVAGETVTFILPPEVQVKGPSGSTKIKVITDNNGIATLDLVSTSIGTWTINAVAGSAPAQSATTTFGNTAQAVKLEAKMIVNDKPADGKSSNVINVIVKDSATGNFRVNEDVNFTVSVGAVLASSTVKTDENGLAQTTLTSLVPGTYTVTVTSGDSTVTTDTTFIIPQLMTNLTVSQKRLDIRESKSSTITLSLTDASGNPVQGKNVEFNISGVSNYSLTGVTDHKDGTYSVDITGNSLGDALITTSIDGKNASGATATVRMVAPTLDNISVNGAHFTLSQDFPKTGFNNAMFKLVLGGGALADEYDWTSDATWIKFNNGLVIFKSQGTSKQVNINIKPKDSVGPSFTYQFSLDKWFIGAHQKAMIFSEAEAFCQGAGYSLPDAATASGNPNPFHDGIRGTLGSLFGEWGNLSSYVAYSGSNEFAGLGSGLAMMTWLTDLAPGSGMSYYINLSKGVTGFNSSDMNQVSAVCVKAL